MHVKRRNRKLNRYPCRDRDKSCVHRHVLISTFIALLHQPRVFCDDTGIALAIIKKQFGARLNVVQREKANVRTLIEVDHTLHFNVWRSAAVVHPAPDTWSRRNPSEFDFR